MNRGVPMKFSRIVCAATLAFTCAFAGAVTLRVSNQGDVQSMDPHSLNESLQLSFTGNVYESLIERDRTMGLAPALATKWTQQSLSLIHISEPTRLLSISY